MMLTGYFFAFSDVCNHYLRRIAGVHFEERVLDACLVFGIIERIGHFTDVMIKGACTDEESIRADGLGCFSGEVGHLHRVLESAGGFFSEGVQQFGVDIGQFDQGDG